MAQIDIGVQRAVARIQEITPIGYWTRMGINELDKLASLMRLEQESLMLQWRQQVTRLPSAQNLNTPTLNDHIPVLLEELAAALASKSEETISEALIEGSPPAHGLQRVDDGFDIEEVVAEYNILRECIHDLADRNDLKLQGKPFRIINRVLDGAIGLAVQTFANQQALEVQRRREEYLAFVAHDLRTPLNAISLAVNVLELTFRSGGGSAESSQMLKTMRRNVQQLVELVSQVIDENTNIETEGGIKLELRKLDLWPVVEALIHDLKPVAGTASTKLVNEIPVDLVVYADAGLLRRVLQNLIANAIKYTPHGQITISARDLVSQASIECCVSDTGIGIAKDLLAKVFDKGESDPENDEGLGLGLAIVKSFIEAHGGNVTIESTEGIGSTVRFSLPNQDCPQLRRTHRLIPKW